VLLTPLKPQSNQSLRLARINATDRSEPALPDNNQRMLLERSFTAYVALPVATSAFGFREDARVPNDVTCTNSKKTCKFDSIATYTEKLKRNSKH